jgi:hypothetical protein
MPNRSAGSGVESYLLHFERVLVIFLINSMESGFVKTISDAGTIGGINKGVAE